jgi:hypothetical protein
MRNRDDEFIEHPPVLPETIFMLFQKPLDGMILLGHSLRVNMLCRLLPHNVTGMGHSRVRLLLLSLTDVVML